MYQSLANLPKRAIIDTNILLNAAFVMQGSSRLAIEKLLHIGQNPIIDEKIEAEAFKILRRYEIKLSLKFKPIEILQSYLKYAKIITLPSSPEIIYNSINKADKHIINAANHYAAWVLTSDIKLAHECQSSFLNIRLPFDVIMDAYISQKKDPPIEYSIRFIGISKNSGSIFARITPLDWAGTPSAEKYTICDIQGLGRLHYDNLTFEWVFLSNTGVSINLKCDIHPNEEWIVAISYKYNFEKDIYSLTIRASKPQDVSMEKNISTKNITNHEKIGEVTFGHSIKRNDHWHGYIKTIVVSPTAIDAKSWRALISIPGAAPDPTASNVLEAALIRVASTNAGFKIPTESSLSNLWL